MKPELDRIKSDVETIQNAMGLAPSFRREWIQWIKRDQWFNLWWCLPGFILIAAALLPSNQMETYLGMGLKQWAGILAAASLLGIAVSHTRRISSKDGRPEAMIRESKRVHGWTKQGLWFNVAVAVQILLYIGWSRQYHIGGDAFAAGLFILLGSTSLVAALSAKNWILLGYSVPFMLYGVCLPLAGNSPAVKGAMFGLMFIAVALSFSIIQVWEIRKIEQVAP